MEDSLKVALGIIAALVGALIWHLKRKGRNGAPQIPQHLIEFIEERDEHKARSQQGATLLLKQSTDERIKDHETRIRALEALSYDHPQRRR